MWISRRVVSSCLSRSQYERSLRGLLIAAGLLIATSPLLANEISGSWSGSYSATLNDPGCTNFSSHNFSGPILVSFQQSGSNVTGNFILMNFKDAQKAVENQAGPCTLVSTTVASPLSGMLSGSSLTGGLTNPGSPTYPLSATVAGDANSMNGTFTTRDGSITFTITRSAAPTVNVTGTWQGSYSFTNDCPITGNGQITLNLSQSGATVTGTEMLTNVSVETMGRCGPTQIRTISFPVNGILTGDTLFIPPTGSGNGGRSPSETVKVTGSLMEGTMSEEGGTGRFTATLNGGAPTVLNFSANPSTIRKGSSTTLLFNAAGSSGVSIDGVGSFGPNGSVTVSPITTTIYSLTAMNPGSVVTNAQTTVTVIVKPILTLGSLLAPILQAAGSTGSGSFTLANNGGAASDVTLTKDGAFFTLSPSSFTLAPGANQRIDVTTNAAGPGDLAGSISVAGFGMPTGISIPVRVISSAPPSGTAKLTPVTNRIDVASAPGTNPSGSVRFTNNGSSSVDAVASADVPWIVLPPTTITLAPGQTKDVPFSIDRSQRPDGNAPIGSVSGQLRLSGLGGSATKSLLDAPPGLATSLVGVIDTARPAANSSSIPPLLIGEKALFVPGVGHIQGSVGLFVSDVAILNGGSSAKIDDLRLFYLPANGTAAQSSQPGSVAPNNALNLADVVKTTFLADAQVGTLQLRSAQIDKLSVAASVFNSSNASGTYGTAIPVFPSDRSVGPGGTLYLTGLLRDGSSHTNLYLQETSGNAAKVTTEFLDPAGTVVGTRKDNVNAFALTSASNVVPQGAVSARVKNDADSTGQVASYATPVDDSSGDTWTVVDWKQRYDESAGEPVIIPVAGAVHGANQTYFRTDASIMNSGTISATGVMRYYDRNGQTVDKQISLDAQKTLFVRDIVTNLFAITTDTVGYIIYTPATGGVVITSRTYTTLGSSNATFGTAVPTLAVSSSLTAGQTRAIGSLEDASLSTISAARPATFRTNFGLVETSGNAVTVRVTLRYSFPTGLTEGLATASRDFVLAPRQFLLVNNVARAILGATRDTNLGDLRNIEVDFLVVDGTGSVVVFTSSIDNGTGDSILRVD